MSVFHAMTMTVTKAMIATTCNIELSRSWFVSLLAVCLLALSGVCFGYWLPLRAGKFSTVQGASHTLCRGGEWEPSRGRVMPVPRGRGDRKRLPFRVRRDCNTGRLVEICRYSLCGVVYLRRIRTCPLKYRQAPFVETSVEVQHLNTRVP